MCPGGRGEGGVAKYPRRIRSLLLCLRDVFPVLNISPVFVDLPLVDLMHRVITCMPGESSCGRFWSLLLRFLCVFCFSLLLFYLFFFFLSIRPVTFFRFSFLLNAIYVKCYTMGTTVYAE